MVVKTVKRIAADLLKVGKSRIWMNPERLTDMETAVTRDDVRRLIKEGAITVRPSSVPSRGRKRLIHSKKRSGRRRGPGSRKGSKGARTRKGGGWPERVRAQRKELRALRDSGKITREIYRDFYRQIKGGKFESRRALLDAVKPKKRRVRR